MRVVVIETGVGKSLHGKHPVYLRYNRSGLREIYLDLLLRENIKAFLLAKDRNIVGDLFNPLYPISYQETDRERKLRNIAQESERHGIESVFFAHMSNQQPFIYPHWTNGSFKKLKEWLEV